MIVRVHKRVQVEVDVDLNDVMAEFLKRTQEATDANWQPLVKSLIEILRMMDKVPDTIIDGIPTPVCQDLFEKMRRQAFRYLRDDDA